MEKPILRMSRSRILLTSMVVLSFALGSFFIFSQPTNSSRLVYLASRPPTIVDRDTNTNPASQYFVGVIPYNPVQSPSIVRQLFAATESPYFKTAATAVPTASPVVHVATPASVRALYMTSWVAGTPSIRVRVLNLVRETEINSVVIDVKDDTGRIAFAVRDPELQAIGAATHRITDVQDLLRELHAEGVYVIGRVSVFQDQYLPSVRPELALVSKSTGAPWKDRRGLFWLDQRNMEVWEYTARTAREAYAQGFDEINFDYIRFPSDGNLADIEYGLSEGEWLDKSAELTTFFAYLDSEVRERGIPTSADLFGQITSEKDDMGIGQTIEGAAPYFDFIAPMVYPSHYYPGFLQLKNPAAHPYEVVKYALDEGVKKLIAASSTPALLRPWLQDFSLGGTTYSAEMVRAQIEATYDAGISSWMLWDPSNRYTSGALLLNSE